MSRGVGYCHHFFTFRSLICLMRNFLQQISTESLLLREPTNKLLMLSPKCGRIICLSISQRSNFWKRATHHSRRDQHGISKTQCCSVFFHSRRRGIQDTFSPGPSFSCTNTTWDSPFTHRWPAYHVYGHALARWHPGWTCRLTARQFYPNSGK